MRAGWQRQSLDAVCVLVTDGTHSSPKTVPSGRPYITVRDITNGQIDFGNCSFIDEVDYTQLCKNGCNPVPGDVLFSKDGTVGKVALVDAGPEFVVLSSLAIVRPDQSAMAPAYLAYAMQSPDFLNAAIGQKTGVAIRRIILKNLKQIQISFPPLPEQHRIVAILDEAFDGIATAKANAEQNLQNARALFESHLQSVFTKRGEGWVETTLGAEIDLLVGFAFKSAQYSNGDEDIRLLRGDNIVQGSLRWEDVKRWPQGDTAAYDRYWLHEGDVVLAMDRPWVKAGLKHATISADDLPCLLVQRTACLRSKVNLDSRFLIYLVRSAAFIQHILGVQTGIGVPHISGQQIKDFAFARPSTADQERIAERLDTLSDEVQTLESIYQQKLSALDDLKKSLLHQAFSGQL